MGRSRGEDGWSDCSQTCGGGVSTREKCLLVSFPIFVMKSELLYRPRRTCYFLHITVLYDNTALQTRGGYQKTRWRGRAVKRIEPIKSYSVITATGARAI